MKCTECGETLWSMLSQSKGAHPECLDDEPIDTLDLEDQLEAALNPEK